MPETATARSPAPGTPPPSLPPPLPFPGPAFSARELWTVYCWLRHQQRQADEHLRRSIDDGLRLDPYAVRRCRHWWELRKLAFAQWERAVTEEGDQ